MKPDHFELNETLKMLRQLKEVDLLKQLPGVFISGYWGNPWDNDKGEQKSRVLPQILSNPCLKLPKSIAIVADALYCNIDPEDAPAFCEGLADGIERLVKRQTLTARLTAYSADLLSDDDIGAKASFGQTNLDQATNMLKRGGPRAAITGFSPFGWRRAVRRRAAYLYRLHWPEPFRNMDTWNIADTPSPTSDDCQEQLARLRWLRLADFRVIDALAQEHANQANHMSHIFSAPVCWKTVPGREHWDRTKINTRETLSYMSNRYALGAAFWAIYAAAINNRPWWHKEDCDRLKGLILAHAIHELAASGALKKCSVKIDTLSPDGTDDLPRDFRILGTEVFQKEYRRVYKIMAEKFFNNIFTF
jgi:hypothetical protein